MKMFAGLDVVGFKRMPVCVVDEAGRIVWRGLVDTHPEALSRALQRWGGKFAKIGLESCSMTPWLVRELAKVGFPTVCMDARAAADAVKSRRLTVTVALNLTSKESRRQDRATSEKPGLMQSRMMRM